MGRKSNINKVKRDNTKSKDIESAICMYLYEKGHSPITTRFKGMGLAECDVISVSKSDYIYEYEIKISKSDFKRDFIKEKHTYMLNEKSTFKRKGEIFYRTTNYFYFVTPSDLVSIDDVPDYAGLIYFNGDSFEIVKKPKLLHDTKASTEFIKKLAHNLSCKLIFKKIQ